MGSRRGGQRYCHCGTRLALDNPGPQCSRCERASRDKFFAPPDVPAEFWEAEHFREAFDRQHIGEVSRAYRLHPYHRWAYGPSGISQRLLGQWVGLTQAQVSRIENGPPLKHLDILAHWARVLQIPPELLWFKLPGQRPASSGEASPPEGHKLPELLGDVIEPGEYRDGSASLAASVHDMGDARSRQEGDDPTKRRDALKLGLVVAMAPGLLRRVLQESAEEAMEFTRAVGATSVGRGTFDHLQAVLHELDRSYSRELPVEQFLVARTYRARVQEMIVGRHTFQEGRQLYVYAAWLDEFLAWLAHDLGNPLAAEAYAIDGFEHADQVGHDELCAWVTDAMASIAMYSHRPARAVAAARKGIEKAPVSHPLAVRLRAQAARAHARLGQREECEQLFTEARELFDHLPARSPRRGTVETATLAEYALTAYSASSYLWLADFEKARRQAEEAVAVHEAAPVQSRSPSREAIARIDLAIALAELGSPDEAVSQGLLALTSSRIVSSVLTRAADLDATIAGRYPGLPEAQQLHEQYREVSQATP
jgi:tetratricopeptide (TPR) repeat protein/transcriptional regulator with XRE-family HTH domain